MKKLCTLSMVFIVTAIIGMGCSNPFGTDGGDGNGGGDINRKNPDALINFFVYAYENRDIDLYDEALDDRFIFQLIPADAESCGLPPTEPWWGKTEELRITGRMFDPNFVPHGDTPKVEAIRAKFSKRGDWSAFGLPVPGADTVDTFWAMFEPEMYIDVRYEDQKQVTKVVNNSYVDIWVTQDLKTPGLWKIIKMQESKKPGS